MAAILGKNAELGNPLQETVARVQSHEWWAGHTMKACSPQYERLSCPEDLEKC